VSQLEDENQNIVVAFSKKFHPADGVTYIVKQRIVLCRLSDF
jgi:hypothetical protein